MLRVSVYVLVLVMSLRIARADTDKEHAARLFEEARALVKQGKYEVACPVFESSYQLDPAIGTELNLADCYEHTNKLEPARKLYDEAAREHPNDKRAKFAQDRADAIGKQLADEAALAKPLEQPAEPPPPPPPPAPTETQRRRSRIYIAIGFGVAGIGALVGAELFAQNADSTRQAAYDSGACSKDLTGATFCSIDGTAQLDSADSTATTSGALAIGGAALAVAGLIVFLTAPQDPVIVTPVVGVREIGVSISARF